MSFIKALENGLFELRIKVKECVSCIFYCVKRRDVVMLHGFIKKSQKTPKKELTTAR